MKLSEIIRLIVLKFFCSHKWKIHHETNVFEHSSDELPIFQTQILICSECGKIKKINL